MTVAAYLDRAAPPAELVVGPVCLYVVGDEEVEKTVPIDVGEGAARAPERRSRAARLRDLREAPLAEVPIERVGTVVGDVEIDGAVVVVVAGAGPHAVLAMADAGLGRHVLELSIPAIAEQPVPGGGRHLRAGDGAAVHEKDVHPAVVIEIDEQPARSHDLREVFVGARAVDVRDAEAGGRGNVAELDLHG